MSTWQPLEGGSSGSGPFDADEVLFQELEAIRDLRHLRGVGTGFSDEDDASVSPTARAHRHRLVGLAFSGGGIRSAIFNLGVLQALAKLGLLRHFDYLSTVSGGGYIGSWLVAWIKRQGRKHAETGLKSEHRCNPIEVRTEGESDEISPIRYLRTYSNYLTPKKGFFSLDTWMAGANYLRNLILNMTILVLFFSMLLLLPRLFVSVLYRLVSWLPVEPPSWITSLWTIALVAALIAMPAAYNIARSLRPASSFEAGAEESDVPPTSGVVFGLVVFPFVLLAVLLAFWLFSAKRTDHVLPWIGLGAASFLGFWILVAVCWFLVWRGRAEAGSWTAVKTWLRMLSLAPVAGATTSWLLALALKDIVSQGDHGAIRWLNVGIWASPGFVLAFWLTGILYIGLLGRLLEEKDRRWWSRVNGWLGIVAVSLLALACATFYAAPLIVWANRYVVGAVSLSWLVSTIAGVVAGRSSATDRKDSSPRLELVARIAPFVFIAGLIAALSWGLDELYPRVREKVQTACSGEPKQLVCRWLLPDRAALESLLLEQARAPENGFSDYVRNDLRESAEGMRGQTSLLFLLTAFLGSAALLFSWRVDINEFSMHNFYRDRLIRAFLGASRRGRIGRRRRDGASPFINFDPRDDLALEDLLKAPETAPSGETGWDGGYDGPYPILNTVLNVASGGADLSWQERQGNSFIFTPLHYGFEPGPEEKLRKGFRRTQDAHWHEERGAGGRRTGGRRTGGRRTGGGSWACGPRLGTAMAVSGAAVSPNMGYHSSPSLAFLMTFFNARLGLWVGNPAQARWRDGSPSVALFTLIQELFGLSRSDSGFVNLADGGFFDNLGIYELVRRRCRFILACDAEADPDLGLDGLANSIRRCRTDFGVDIEFDTGPIRIDPQTGFSRWHCSVGTVHYDLADQEAPKGILIYLKASLTGDEPDDVLNYHRRNPSFPHESTADQWFDESQFESYRRLGYHIAGKVFGAADIKPEDWSPEAKNIEKIFVSLRRAWYPPSSAAGRFTQHTRTLGQLFDRLRQDSDLEHLHAEIYRETVPFGHAGHKPSPERLRKGFYFCNELIQLMEDVYLDLELEKEWEHPDNRGWINLFRHWARSDTFRKAWTASASTYGLRFQEFCYRRLFLGLGEIKCEVLWSQKEGGIEEFLSRPAKDQPLEAEEVDLLERLMWTERDEVSPMRDKVDKVFSGRLLTLSSSRELRKRLKLTPKDEKLGAFTFGFAAVDAQNRLTFLRIRRPLRNQGLARYLLKELVDECGVKWDDLPSKEELQQLGLIELIDGSQRVGNMLKSVVNEVEMASRVVRDPVRLPDTAVRRPREASWLHALAFLYWAVAYEDRVASNAEKQEILTALVFIDPPLDKKEAESVVWEAREWHASAQESRERLKNELVTVKAALEREPWFDSHFRYRHNSNLKRMVEVAGRHHQSWALPLLTVQNEPSPTSPLSLAFSASSRF